MAVDFQKGQTVTFAHSTSGSRASGWGGSRQFRQGDRAEVTRVNRNTLTVKVINGYSYNVNRSALATPNGETWVPAPPAPPKPKPRPLGQKPEGDHIAIDDPRIAWIWADAEKAAGGYCREYDNITDRLGIPGRMRDMRVNLKIAGIDIVATVKARSTKEAEELLRKKLAETKA